MNEGDILAEIETDKATMEFESFQVRYFIIYRNTMKVNLQKSIHLLAILGPAGTDVSGVASNFKETSKQETKKTETPKKETVVTSSAVEKSHNKTQVNSSNGRLFVSPLAKKIAEEKGINLSQVQGSGENGRIIKQDVENFVPVSQSGGASVGKFVPTGQEDFDEVCKLTTCVRLLLKH